MIRSRFRSYRADHGRLSRYRRGDCGSARRGRRACNPGGPDFVSARRGRGTDSPGGRKRNHRSARPHAGRGDRQVRRSGRRTLGTSSTSSHSTRPCIGSLTPVQDIDPKEYSRILSINLLANQALLAAFDPLLKESGSGGHRRLDLFVGGEPRAFWAPMVIKGGAGKLARRLCRRDRVPWPYQGPRHRSGRNPNPDARQCLPGEEPESVKRQRLWRRPSSSVCWRTPQPAKRCASKPRRRRLPRLQARGADANRPRKSRGRSAVAKCRA